MISKSPEMKNQFLYLFADCFPVKGYTRTLICDISRKKMYFIDNTYYDLLTELKQKSIGEIEDLLDSKLEVEYFYEFITFLIDEELAILVDDISKFPSINLKWDHPSLITNAIIDIREKSHNFEKIFSELDEVNCYHLQIRSYTSLTLENLHSIISLLAGKNFRSVEFIIKYSEIEYPSEEIINFLNKYPIASILFYGVEIGNLTRHTKKHNNLSYVPQNISSCEACGVINKNALTLSDIGDFTENINFNGFLNRKISIDELGEIKNCPSMEKSYGNINKTSLVSISQNKNFQKLWKINKDSIETCKVCEFRYICTDCRAYTNDGGLYSKPLKCSYDPYTAKWQDEIIQK